jgi:RNase P subunit RPR2
MPPSASKTLRENSLLHLHAAAQTLLPVNQALSSHLGTKLLDFALEEDVTLPPSFLETKVCQRCGTLYLPGVTCLVRTRRSRRQKRKVLRTGWVSYECLVCRHDSRIEVELPLSKKETTTIEPIVLVEKLELKEKVVERKEDTAGKRKKRNKLEGLRKAVEKSKAEKTTVSFNLMDLMKVD